MHGMPCSGDQGQYHKSTPKLTWPRAWISSCIACLKPRTQGNKMPAQTALSGKTYSGYLLASAEQETNITPQATAVPIGQRELQAALQLHAARHIARQRPTAASAFRSSGACRDLADRLLEADQDARHKSSANEHPGLYGHSLGHLPCGQAAATLGQGQGGSMIISHHAPSAMLQEADSGMDSEGEAAAAELFNMFGPVSGRSRPPSGQSRPPSSHRTMSDKLQPLTRSVRGVREDGRTVAAHERAVVCGTPWCVPQHALVPVAELLQATPTTGRSCVTGCTLHGHPDATQCANITSSTCMSPPPLARRPRRYMAHLLQVDAGSSGTHPEQGLELLPMVDSPHVDRDMHGSLSSPLRDVAAALESLEAWVEQQQQAAGMHGVNGTGMGMQPHHADRQYNRSTQQHLHTGMPRLLRLSTREPGDHDHGQQRAAGIREPHTTYEPSLVQQATQHIVHNVAAALPDPIHRPGPCQAPAQQLMTATAKRGVQYTNNAAATVADACGLADVIPAAAHPHSTLSRPAGVCYSAALPCVVPALQPAYGRSRSGTTQHGAVHAGRLQSATAQPQALRSCSDLRAAACLDPAAPQPTAQHVLRALVEGGSSCGSSGISTRVDGSGGVCAPGPMPVSGSAAMRELVRGLVLEQQALGGLLHDTCHTSVPISSLQLWGSSVLGTTSILGIRRMHSDLCTAPPTLVQRTSSMGQLCGVLSMAALSCVGPVTKQSPCSHAFNTVAATLCSALPFGKRSSLHRPLDSW